ncbi:MAG TPA: TolC family protein [Gemmatimonadaceae bacterium]|nr:TolC family protein [Gemmatimonadaceae bacterium]
MMRRFIVTLIAIPSIAAAQTPSDGLPVITLAEARRRSISIDPDAVAARSRVDVATSERRAAFTNLITPNLRATTTYTHFSEPFFNFGTGGISPNSASATFDASYSVLGAGKFGTLKNARASLASAEALETSSRFRTMLETDAAYFAVLADKELSRVAADRVRRAEEQLNIARVRVIAGESVQSDSLRLLLEASRARLAILSMDSSLTASRLRLGRRIGLSCPAEAAPVDSILPRDLPMSEEQAIAEMRARGPDVEAARAQEKSANAAVLTARERYFPEINIGATLGRYDSELFPDALKRNQWNASVSLPIWNGGTRELAVARARADRNVASAARADTERAAGEVMAQAYRGYITARGGIDLALVGLAAATENYRVQNARYREGATTIVDLLEAQVALSEAQAQLIRARYASRLSLAQIEALLGRRIFETPTPNLNSR